MTKIQTENQSRGGDDNRSGDDGLPKFASSVGKIECGAAMRWRHTSATSHLMSFRLAADFYHQPIFYAIHQWFEEQNVQTAIR